MRLIRCDRCGKEIQPVLTDNRIGYVALNIKDLNTDDLIDGNPFEHADFCPECMKEIEAFIRKAPTQQDPEMSETELINKILEGGDSLVRLQVRLRKDRQSIKVRSEPCGTGSGALRTSPRK